MSTDNKIKFALNNADGTLGTTSLVLPTSLLTTPLDEDTYAYALTIESNAIVLRGNDSSGDPGLPGHSAPTFGTPAGVYIYPASTTGIQIGSTTYSTPYSQWTHIKNQYKKYYVATTLVITIEYKVQLNGGIKDFGKVITTPLLYVWDNDYLFDKDLIYGN